MDGLFEAIMQAVEAEVGPDGQLLDEDAVVQAFGDLEEGADRFAQDSFNDEVNTGSLEEQQDMDFGYGGMWVAEADACLDCGALNGTRANDGEYGSFDGRNSYRTSPLNLDSFDGHPPRHIGCRCRIEPWNGDPELLDAMRRESDRAVLRGWSLKSESTKARIEAADRLLKKGVKLPKSVQARARRDVAAGKFERGRQFPGRTKTSTGPIKAPKPAQPAPAPSPAQTLERGLEAGIRRTDYVGGKGSGVRRVTFKDGSEAIRRNTYSRSEHMAHRVGDALGSPIPSTRMGVDGRLYQQVLQGETAGASRNRQISELIRSGRASTAEEANRIVQAEWRQMLASPEGRRIGLMDYLTGQGDRHMNNWIIRDGKVWAIDNEAAFHSRTFSPFAQYWAKPGVYTNKDIDEAAKAIAALRPEFEASGMARQWSEMSARLEYLRVEGRFDPDAVSRMMLDATGNIAA